MTWFVKIVDNILDNGVIFDINSQLLGYEKLQFRRKKRESWLRLSFNGYKTLNN